MDGPISCSSPTESHLWFIALIVLSEMKWHCILSVKDQSVVNKLMFGFKREVFGLDCLPPTLTQRDKSGQATSVSCFLRSDAGFWLPTSSHALCKSEVLFICRLQIFHLYFGVLSISGSDNAEIILWQEGITASTLGGRKIKEILGNCVVLCLFSATVITCPNHVLFHVRLCTFNTGFLRCCPLSILH